MLGEENNLGIESVHCGAISVIGCVRSAGFRCRNSIYNICQTKLIFMFLQLPFVENLALNVQMLHIKVHKVRHSMFLRARDWDASVRHSMFLDVHAIPESLCP